MFAAVAIAGIATAIPLQPADMQEVDQLSQVIVSHSHKNKKP